MRTGSVTRLNRWPVKSLRGERVTSALFDERGMAGDRSHALVDLRPKRSGSVLTVRQNPQLLHWRSSYAGARPGAPVLTAPDGKEWSWADPGLRDALSESLGLPLDLRAEVGMQDRGPTVLVTVEASRAALEQELGTEVDLDRFRPNLHVSLDAPAFAEESWYEGTKITVGEVVLETVGPHAGPCIRCAVPSWDPRGQERWPKLQTWLIEQHENKFGVIMRVTSPGTISVGDTVSAVPGAAD